jgi:methylated-DNA-[protein]-cysteine S-methyltransferase
VETPFGPFVLAEGANGWMRTGWTRLWTEGRPDRQPGWRSDPRLRPELVQRLRRALAGREVEFGDVSPPPGPPFFHRCWSVAQSIPRGETISYAELAERAGRPGAARAAGQAMRQNPVPIIVPCHRVRAAGGGLHGFAGRTGSTGMAMRLKRALLEAEGAALPGV